MNWETLYCPNPACRLYGVRWRQSLLVKNGSSRGYKQAVCRACGQSVVLRYGTAYFELQADPASFDIAIRALAEGNSLPSTARIVQIDKDTAGAWLDRAARHCRPILLSFWQQLPLSECQLDEFQMFQSTPMGRQKLLLLLDVFLSRHDRRLCRVCRPFVLGLYHDQNVRKVLLTINLSTTDE